jgi:ribosomal protein L35
MQKPNIVIRYGASNDDITVDGHTFVRHKLTGKEKHFLRNVIIDSLVKCGSVRRSK